MDEPGDLAQARGRLDERMNGLARGRVDRRDAHVVSGVPQDLGRRVGVLLAHVGQQDVLADADPPRDRLADLTGSDDDDHAVHVRLPVCGGQAGRGPEGLATVHGTVAVERTVWRSQELGSTDVVVVGDTAVLYAEVTDVVVSGDETETFRMPMTQVWVREGVDWKCLSGHAGPRRT